METRENARSEGKVAPIKSQSARLPSDLFLWTALASIGVSATLKFIGQKRAAMFVGQLAPSLLLLGVYNKIIKVQGLGQKDLGGTIQRQPKKENAAKLRNKKVPENEKKPKMHPIH